MQTAHATGPRPRPGAAPLALLCLLAVAPAAARAHARLQSAVPAPGSTIAHAPPELELTYSEALEPRFSRIVVTGPDGAVVSQGPVRIDPRDARHVLVPVGKLAPGTYMVDWRAVSIDTHKTHGTYRFTIGP